MAAHRFLPGVPNIFLLAIFPARCLPSLASCYHLSVARCLDFIVYLCTTQACLLLACNAFSLTCMELDYLLDTLRFDMKTRQMWNSSQTWHDMSLSLRLTVYSFSPSLWGRPTETWRLLIAGYQADRRWTWLQVPSLKHRSAPCPSH